MLNQRCFTHLKVVVIGCGNWGKNHVRVLSQLGVLYGICDENSETLNKLSKEFNTRALTFQQVLENSQIDAIFIATPASTHYSLAKMALLAGKHTFVEKPLAMNTEDAQHLVELSKQNNKILMVGHILQYHQGFKTLKKLNNEGKLGPIQYIYSNRLNLGKYRTEENIWWSFAPHDISMILSLTNKMPSQVTAVEAKYLQHTHSDITHTYLNFPEGQLAHVFVSWLHPYKEQKLVVIGEKAMAIFDDSKPWAEKLQLHPYPGEWVDGLPRPVSTSPQLIQLEPEEPLVSEDSHFLQCIVDGSVPVTNGEEGARVVEVLSAAERSIKNKSFVNCAQTVTHAYNKSSPYFIHETAIIEDEVQIGNETKIWQFSHLRNNTKIGQKCVIGQNVSIGPNVNIGDQCKIQNNVSLYEGVTLEAHVFVGPSVTFTNIKHPRAFIDRKEEFKPTIIKKGASLGANSTIVCGVTLHPYSFVAAGSVVTRDVEAFRLVAGNPAKPIGWVNKLGHRVAKRPEEDCQIL